MADAILSQADFGGGIFQDRDGPGNTFQDATNALISDAGKPYRRGGIAYHSSANAGEALLGVADVFTSRGQRTLAWGASGGGHLFRLDGSLAPQTIPAGGLVPRPQERLEVLTGAAIFTTPTNVVTAWAGSEKTAGYSTGNVTVTHGSATVTGGGGTAWTANADAGMFLSITGTAAPGIVKSVDSNTAITLTRPWAGPSAVAFAYSLGVTATVGGGALDTAQAMAVVAGRLLVGDGSRVWFTEPYQLAFDTYHELPSGAQVTGMAGLGPQTAIVFTTAGVFAISNLALDPLDALGNEQHDVSLINRDLILWGDNGIAAWAGALIAPARDDVYLLSPGGAPTPVSPGIRKRYRSYVEAGYTPGTGAVYRGHYLLPVVNGSSLIDVLVCRLDRGSAWTRWTDQAAGLAYAARAGTPGLLGITGQRVSNVTGAWTPASANKQDPGAVHNMSLTTRAYPLGPGAGKHRATRLRARYELVDAASDNPTVAATYATTDTNTASLSAVRGGGESDGTDFSVWPVNKRAQSMSFGLTTSGPAAGFTLRGLEVFVSQSGEQ